VLPLTWKRTPTLELRSPTNARFWDGTRTSLALIGAGLAVAQFLKVGVRVALLLPGIGLLALGSSTSLTSYRQHRRIQRAIRHGQPIPPCAMPHILASGAVVFAVLATVLAVLAFSHR
jgi:putative membrane protein